MSRNEALSISLIAAALVLVSWLPAPARACWAQLFHDRLALRFLLFFALFSMPICYWTPRVRAGFFGRAWKVPASTYVLPEWLVVTILVFSCGHLLAALVLAVFADSHMFWIFGLVLLNTFAFWVGARHRLRHPREEFEIPWFRWPLRKFGWRLRN